MCKKIYIYIFTRQSHTTDVLYLHTYPTVFLTYLIMCLIYIYIYILRNLVDYMEQFLSRQGSVSQIKQIQITSTKGIVQIKEEEEEELKNLCHRSFQKVLHYFINNLLKTWHKFKKNT